MDHNPLDAIVRVELTDEPIIPGRSGTNDRGPWTIPPKIPAYLWQADKYPTKIELLIPEAGRPRPGIYLIAGNPFSVGVKGARTAINFDERNIELIPVEALQALKPARAA